MTVTPGGNSAQSAPPNSATVLDFLAPGFACWYATSLIVFLAALVANDYMKPGPHPMAGRTDLVELLANWDGKWYRGIVVGGYHYQPDNPSNVAFFPSYPLLARWLAAATGMTADQSLVAVANACLVGAFIALKVYLHRRLGDDAAGAWCLVAMGLMPMTLFFRMAYSESLFLLITIVALDGMNRRWPWSVIALIVGLATATRPVGVALLLPFALHVWESSATVRFFAIRITGYLPLACWGLAAFMVFQWLAFDEPLAFAKTQANWRVRPEVSVGERMVALLTLEPIWSVYTPSSPCYWHAPESDLSPVFNLHFANPIYFVATVGLIIVGGWKRWLDRNELLLSAGLLLIPYVTRSHEMCMGAMGRFTVVVFPAYIVLGHLLARMPAQAAAALLALSGFFMGIYAALFAAGYAVF